MGLDKFLAHNTSEDNVSFGEIMKEAEKKHRIKHAWLFDKEQQQLDVCPKTFIWLFLAECLGCIDLYRICTTLVDFLFNFLKVLFQINLR